MDKKEITKKILLDPLDWLTLTPFLIGATAGLGAWAFSVDSGIAIAGAVVPILISAGIYVNRLLFGWKDKHEQIINDWRESVEKQRDDELDQLYRDLQNDGDPRTENLLKDLRTLTKALMSEQTESFVIYSYDIVNDVDKLFRVSVDYLKESLELWNMAEEMKKESIREQLLKHREALIEEVEGSLDNLGDVLGSMKKAVVDSSDGRQLAELREELSTRLRIAEEVEGKMKSMRQNSVSRQDEERYLKLSE